MSNVLILGANGKIAKLVEDQLLSQTDHSMKLFLRKPSRANVEDANRETVIGGDSNNADDLTKTLTDIDIVYANLAGANIESQAKTVTEAMKKAGVKRLIWISSLGVYDEVPGNFGKWNHEMLDDGYLPTYAAAAKVIENSGLDYTLIRPAWLSNKNIVSYEITLKGQPFKGTEVSRKSIADVVVNLINDPSQHIGDSLGVNQPNTDGDKPSFY